MAQPKWTRIGNLGDASPLEYGGMPVYRDETGVYGEEAEYWRETEEGKSVTLYRFELDRCTLTPDGILSDNQYHPEYPAWFADTINGIAHTSGMEPAVLRSMLCSADPRSMIQPTAFAARPAAATIIMVFM